MKLMLVVCTILSVLVFSCLAAPQNNVDILEYESDNIGIGGYSFNYKLSDGTTRSEEAVVKNAGTENEYLSIKGSISWVAPDGQTYTLTFVADENGFQPEGAHIPK